MDKLIAEKKSYVEIIKAGRTNIAQLKKQKANLKSLCWSDAQGTAKEKEDYVKSCVADLERDINEEIANIEYAYNMIEIVNDKMVYLEND